jgi:hypothetical protein
MIHWSVGILTQWSFWKLYSNGLPEKLAITNMTSYNGIIVASGSERQLKRGMNTDR